MTSSRVRSLTGRRILVAIQDRLVRRCRIVMLRAAPWSGADASAPTLDVTPGSYEQLCSPAGAGPFLDPSAIARARDRLAIGDCCYLVHVDRRCAGYGWVRDRGEIDIAEVGMRREMPRGTVVLYDFLVFPEFRGRGIYTRLLTSLRARHADQACIIYAEHDNAASLAGIRHAGFTGWKRFSSWRICGTHFARRELDFRT
jgi:GNAT superfamily N-acetyltransferase